jgi:lipoyl(octanoyl) transferase
MREICNIHRLGLVPYQEAWALQGRLAAQIASGERPQTLLLLQHPHVYTFGRRGDPANLLWDQAELERRQVQVLWVDRGGDVTYHGPGQLVGYPLLALTSSPSPFQGEEGGGETRQPYSRSDKADGGEVRLPRADYIGYLRRLEQVLILVLAHFGVAGMRLEGKTGVWVEPQPVSQPAKIAAIGVKVDVHGVSRHGFALNVDPEMSYWEGIIGCGLAGFPTASLAEFLHPAPAMEAVEQAVIASFQEVFGFRMVEARLEDWPSWRG